MLAQTPKSTQMTQSGVLSNTLVSAHHYPKKQLLQGATVKRNVCACNEPCTSVCFLIAHPVLSSSEHALNTLTLVAVYNQQDLTSLKGSMV